MKPTPEYTPPKRWDLLEATYYSNKGYLDGSYLVPHSRESVEQYEARKLKARPTNLAKTLIDEQIGELFRVEPIRNREVDKNYNGLLRDIAEIAAIEDSAFVEVKNGGVNSVLAKDAKKYDNLIGINLQGLITDILPYGTAHELAKMQHRLYNLTSLIDTIADDQAYPILSMPGDSHNLTKEAGKPLTGADTSPSYISPSLNISELRELKKELETEMRETMGQGEIKKYGALNVAQSQIKKLDEDIMTALGVKDYKVTYAPIVDQEKTLEIFSTLDAATTPPPPETMAKLVQDIMGTQSPLILEHYKGLAELPTEPTETPEV